MGDPNLYRYCGNDPLNHADPSGLDFIDNAAHFAAGWGDRLTGGLTKDIRDWLCDLLDLPRWEPRDPCDEWYLAGHVGGAIHDWLLTRGRGRTKLATHNQQQPKGGVYKITEKSSGEVVYVGRSSDVAKRASQHRNGRYPKDQYDFTVEHYTDDYATQRGLEQRLYDKYNPRDNRNRPISPRNPRRDDYMRAAEEFLSRAQQPIRQR